MLLRLSSIFRNIPYDSIAPQAIAFGADSAVIIYDGLSYCENGCMISFPKLKLELTAYCCNNNLVSLDVRSSRLKSESWLPQAIDTWYHNNDKDPITTTWDCNEQVYTDSLSIAEYSALLNKAWAACSNVVSEQGFTLQQTSFYDLQNQYVCYKPSPCEPGYEALSNDLCVKVESTNDPPNSESPITDNCCAVAKFGTLFSLHDTHANPQIHIDFGDHTYNYAYTITKCSGGYAMYDTPGGGHYPVSETHLNVRSSVSRNDPENSETVVYHATSRLEFIRFGATVHSVLLYEDKTYANGTYSHYRSRWCSMASTGCDADGNQIFGVQQCSVSDNNSINNPPMIIQPNKCVKLSILAQFQVDVGPLPFMKLHSQKLTIASFCTPIHQTDIGSYVNDVLTELGYNIIARVGPMNISLDFGDNCNCP